MTFTRQSVAFLGLGLISGSLASALRDSGWQGELLGWGPREPSLKRGLELGIIDRYSLDLDEVIGSSDMLIIGAPPVATGDLLAELLPKAMASAHQPIVTDLASIKGWVIDRANCEYSRFVPGHPIAGSEHSGVAASRVDLFSGREVILTPNADLDPIALKEVTAMWALTGARVTHMPVADHDAALAASSHSPHMLAYTLTMVLADHPLQPIQHGGGALRDMTRIAGSDPVMWRDIALTNRDALLTALTEVEGELAQLKRLIEASDGSGMQAYFTRCRDVRREHDRVLNPLFEQFDSNEESKP